MARPTERAASVSAVRLTVKAKPRARKSRIVRIEGLSVEVALAAQPVDGAANEELLAVLSRVLGVPKRDVELVLGTASKQKVVLVSGVTEERVIALLTEASHRDAGPLR